MKTPWTHTDRDWWRRRWCGFFVVAGLRAGVGVAPGSMFYVDNRANSGYIRIHVGISTEKAKKIAETLRANKQ